MGEDREDRITSFHRILSRISVCAPEVNKANKTLSSEESDFFTIMHTVICRYPVGKMRYRKTCESVKNFAILRYSLII